MQSHGSSSKQLHSKGIQVLNENPFFTFIIIATGWERLIRSHSSARFCFELSGNSN